MYRIFQVVSALVVLLLIVVNLGGSLWVCDTCGCMSRTSMQLFRTVDDTPFSRASQELRFYSDHSHQLRFGCGGGFGFCALGRGRSIFQTVRGVETAQFLRCTARFRGEDEARRWFHVALDYRNSAAIPRWLLINNFPKDGFEFASDYDAFRLRADPEWATYVKANAKNWGTNASPESALSLIPSGVQGPH